MIFDLIEEYKSEKAYSHGEEKAIKLFSMQADAIRNIRTTDGYLAIKDFLKREKDLAIDRLASTNKADLPEVRALLNVTNKLLNFLENREKDLPKSAS